jgi:hypothetical protein
MLRLRFDVGFAVIVVYGGWHWACPQALWESTNPS